MSQQTSALAHELAEHAVIKVMSDGMLQAVVWVGFPPVKISAVAFTNTEVRRILAGHLDEWAREQ